MKLKNLTWHSPKETPKCGQSILMICQFKDSELKVYKYLCYGLYISKFCENVRLANLPYAYYNGDYGNVELEYRDYDDEYYIPCGFYETVESTVLGNVPKLYLVEDDIIAWTPIDDNDIYDVEVKK